MITLSVTDTGNTNRFDLVSFAVGVGECVVPGLGHIVLRAGDGGRVPANLISTVPLASLRMTVGAPVDRLVNFGLEPIVPEICTNSFVVLSNSLHLLSMAACSNQSLIGTQQLAWLHFSTVPNQSSAFVPLTLDNTVGLRPNGTEVRNFAPQAGRVVVVGEKPLLEALRTDNGQVGLIIYSRLGLTNSVETTAQLHAPGTWEPLGEIISTNLLNHFPTFIPLGQQRFYRVRLK